MKSWLICSLLVLGLPATMHASDESFRVFRPVDAAKLERKVPAGYGKVFIEAARANNIDPVLLAAISAHESGAWKSAAARHKNKKPGAIAPGCRKRTRIYRRDINRRRTYQSIKATEANSCRAAATKRSGVMLANGSAARALQ